MVVFGQSGCVRARLLYSGKVNVFQQKFLHSGKSGCIGQNGCFRAQWLYLGKFFV